MFGALDTGFARLRMCDSSIKRLTTLYVLYISNRKLHHLLGFLPSI